MCNKNKFLYHYTKFDSVKSILKNESLRFSDFRFLNDKKELKYAINFTIDYCKKMLNEYRLYSVLCNKANTLLGMVQRLSHNIIMLSKIEKINNDYILNRLIVYDMIYYIFSTSMNKNDKYMWEKYANNECCIIFNKSKLEEWFDVRYKAIYSNTTQYLANSHDVSYGDEEINTLITMMLFDKVLDASGIYMNNSFLYRLMGFVKSKDWAPENEWRLGFALRDSNIINYPNLIHNASYNTNDGYRHAIDLLNLPLEQVIYKIQTKSKTILNNLKNYVSKLHLNIKITLVK